MKRTVFRKSLYLSVAFLAASISVRAGDKKPPEGSFSGLIHDKAVDKLAKPISKKSGSSTFALSVFTDAKAFQAFTDAAGLKKLPFEVDFDKQAVVVAVLKEHTNRLRFKSWNVKDGTGELVFFWDGIEPFYKDRYPAVLYRVDRKGLDRVAIRVNGSDKTLGEIDLKK